MARSEIPANTNDAKHTRRWWPELLSASASAQYVGVHRTTMMQAIAEGAWPIKPIRGALGLSEDRPKYRRREIDDWLLAGCPLPWKWEPTALQTMAEAVEERRRELTKLTDEVLRLERRANELGRLIEKPDHA